MGKQENIEDGLCTYESGRGGCPNRALIGGDRCGLHKIRPEPEDQPVPIPEVPIPERHIKPDPDWRNWVIVLRISPEHSLVECPFCAGAVHESSAPMHAKWHQSLNETFASKDRAIQAAFNA